MLTLKHLKNVLAGAAAAVAAMLSLSSCGGVIYDDLDPCPRGLELRFIYDYNLEFANGFMKQVDCLTLLVYDENGNYLQTRTVTDRKLLSDENWRMTLDLPEGHYKLVAYGGMACQESSFSYVTQPASGQKLDNLKVQLDRNLLTSPAGTKLHNLFYAYLEADVRQTDMAYSCYTLEMKKDTNNIRLVLSYTDGSPVDNTEFDFEITDDNTLMGWDNEVIPAGVITYHPWTRGNAASGLNADGTEVISAFAELSTARLVTYNSPTLHITLRSDGSDVVKIPLINCLMLLRSEQYRNMPPQEFLDRCSEWSVVFFLNDDNRWAKNHIIINDWTVRINDIDTGTL